MKKPLLILSLSVLLLGCSFNKMSQTTSTPTKGNTLSSQEASLSAHSTKCTYSLSKNNAPKENYIYISEFVKNEVRPELSNNNGYFYITIEQNCQDNTEHIVKLKMLRQNYYIVEINDTNLPKHVVDYNNRLPLDISRDEFDKVIAETNNYNFNKFPTKESPKTYSEIKELIYQQRILKMYAFVFAEAARFESIENAVKKTIDGMCQTSWHDFDYTVHNWKNISAFIKSENLTTSEQITGGGYDQLRAPITVSQELDFDKALMSGKNYEFSRSAPLLYLPKYICIGV